MIDRPVDRISSLILSRHDEPVRTGRECKLCHHPAWHFDYVDFHKSCNDYPLGRSGILVEYFRCQRCELIFTDFCDFWSPADFSARIYNEDYIKVDPEYVEVRPRHSAEELAPSLRGAEQARILDYGSGSGKFAVEMGLRGFPNVESYDPFAHPVPPKGKFDIITCFDVIEHSPTPAATFSEILSYLADDGCIVVGQTLQPYNIEEVRGDWWYIAPRNGHVTAYSSETMQLFADAHGLLFDDFGDLFALSRPCRSAWSESIIERRIPKKRKHVFQAPPSGSGAYDAWQAEEQAGDRWFRWTRQSEVSLGTHPLPVGECRIVLRYVMSSSPEFLTQSSLRAGNIERPLRLHNEELVAVFNFPEASRRHLVLRTPPVESLAAKGIGNDIRAMGIALWCEEQAPVIEE